MITGPSIDPKMLQTMLTLLAEIRDNSLLNEEQRRLKLERLIAEQKQRQFAQAQALLNQGDFHRAQLLLDELIRRFGPSTELDTLTQRIAEARGRLEKQQIEAARKKLDDLLSVNAWDRAEEVTADLVARHPNSAEARELAERIRAQKSQFQAEQRTRLFAEAQRHTTRKEWQAALQTVRLLVRLYPESAEAEALKEQLPTLEANAEIAVRQALEAQIKDLIKEQRYAEAVETAERVIRDYPASPQAAALQDQLPRLRDLARGVRGATPL
jgi:outer membrane protein assembly factor BamD (BamD/ComL family)